MLGPLTDSEWDSSSDGFSSEQDENDFSYVLQARNIFSSLEESIGKIDDFLSFDRGFTHGDIVRSITDPSGQMGRIVNLNVLVDLEDVYGNVIKEVDSKKLKLVRAFSVGDYVIRGPWLGKVDKVVDSVTVLLDDGSKCEVTLSDPDKLVPVSENILEDSPYLYYPGQRVHLRFTHAHKPSGWLCGNWRDNQDLGTVCAVEAGLVYVDWITSVVTGDDSVFHPPPSLHEPKNLTLLSSFPHWQLGDWCIYPVSSCKGTIEQNSLHAQKNLERGFQRHEPCSSLDELFVIVKTKTKIDVIWQDGSFSSAVDSLALLPVGAVNSHEFWPQHFVIEKEESNSQKWGVVQAVDAKEQTVKVQWRTRPENEANDTSEDQKEETVSAYELLEHPDFNFCFGDVVFRVVRNPFEDTSSDDPGSTDISLAEEANFNEKEIGKDENEYLQTHYLSCIGMVMGFRANAVMVKWANGFTTEVAPYEIYRIEKSEGSTTTTMSYDESVQEPNQKNDSDETSANQQEKDSMKFVGTSENCNKHGCGRDYSSFPRTAIGFLTNIAATLFGSHAFTSFLWPMRSHDSEDQSETEILVEEEVIRPVNLSNPEEHPCDLGLAATAGLIEEGAGGGEDMVELSCSIPAKDLVGFKQFDMVNGCSDHHYLASNKGMAQSQGKRSWVKKVQHEWSILEANLPESIYVRVYEERMDILRAALVGAPGTPYHDGLFFFDIQFPPDYPHEPPLVHYNSGGLRLNPNLYESGKVCLSLLNTWTGSGSEVWNSESSTILQVLLSLQALVLNDKPYFNEAGYDKQMGRTEGEKNSVSYNENAFLGTCRSMLYLLHKTPKHFEALVEEHFTRRAQHIMSACKAYMEGAPLGWLENTDENMNGSSTGFKIMLGKLYPKLVEAFSEIGADCNSQSTELEM